MFVTSAARVSFLPADVFQNHQETPLPFRLLGFRGARTPPLFKFLFLEDKRLLRAQMLGWAEAPNLARIVPSHGPVIEQDAAGFLRRAAEAL